MPEDTHPAGASQTGGQTTAPVAGGGFPPPPPIASGEEVYDQIMSKIEPELTTAQLPVLKDKYKDEMPDAAKVRADRYQKAFAEYDKQYAQYMQTQAAAVSAFKNQIHNSAESYSQQTETQALGNIESAISIS